VKKRGTGVEQMQHQTLPDAPKTNEGIRNWDLLVILFPGWCRPPAPTS